MRNNRYCILFGCVLGLLLGALFLPTHTTIPTLPPSPGVITFSEFPYTYPPEPAKKRTFGYNYQRRFDR